MTVHVYGETYVPERMVQKDYGRAQWTLIECPLSQEFKYTRLATIGDKILAISK